MHKDGDGNEYDDGAVLYSTTDPGGCFVANGHTHNKTGTCPTTTSTTTHTLILMEISNEGTSADQGHYWCGACNHMYYFHLPDNNYPNPYYHT